MTSHWLIPLFEPQSVAIIGASATERTVGRSAIDHLTERGYSGRLYAVNSKYSRIGDVECFASAKDLPESPDLVVIAVNQGRVEEVFGECIQRGARAAVIFADCRDGSRNPSLADRVAAMATAAKVPVCGGNGMGFQNFTNRTHATFTSCEVTHATCGNVSLIAHSGSVIQALATDIYRLRYNLTVSAGQEINGTVADYLDYALDLPSTKVVALFLESIREPARFVAALEKAVSKRIPVVALKVGKTHKSAAMAISHSGAMVGDAATFQALFDRYNVVSVRTLDELAATSQLLAHLHDAGPGDLGVVMDSGGLRELLVDLADEKGVSIPEISEVTRKTLQGLMSDGMLADNPLDVWGGRTDAKTQISKCLETLLQDHQIGFGAIATEAGDIFQFASVYAEIARETQSRTGKPVFMMTSFSGIQNRETAAALAESDIPVINGADTALAAVRAATSFRKNLSRVIESPDWSPSPTLVSRWRTILHSDGDNDNEARGLSLLNDFGIPVVRHQVCNSLDEVVATAKEYRFPLVIKTAIPDAHHKSDIGGVILGLRTIDEVTEAYSKLEHRLGSRVLLQEMVAAGLEISFGFVVDAQFGAVTTIAPGGKWIEFFSDRQTALAPFGVQQARLLIGRLKLHAILEGRRGEMPYDVEQLAKAFSRFSVLADALKEELTEFDVNPVIVSPEGIVVVDALPVSARPRISSELS